MLGNQAWRFLTKPNSLVSKEYKARYFLTKNYLDSSAGHNPSFVWRSIWEAGDVVKAGVRWVVGSGEMINILGQPWLLDDQNPFITSDSPALANNKVSPLYFEDMSKGNEFKVSRHKSNGGMGFSDFRDFNLAMLGNQAWRFLTKPNSLVSIWEAGDVVKEGVRWVVGLGEMINILGQPWLLDDHNPFITSDSPALANNKVSSIMSMEHRGWDDEILKDLFNNRDQECIRSVLLNEEYEKYAQSSLFSVRFPKLVDGDSDSSWVKPHESIIKVSVDAATFREYSGSGMGVIVIDAGGWQGVIVESDFLVAVQAIRSKAPMVSPFGRVIEACRAMLRDLNTVSLFFIKRSANVAAHELARVSYSFPDRVFDWRFVPIRVFNALKADLLS
ncbi:uncharacterized protein LOC141704019 [Apium graveolens]|uniref:uncharacterized protein LOC141704019 n=1 Tax=Apium graveolens TaxID=4045 RepID=UPI003D7956C9